jgi:hypothetical protein
MKRYDRAAVISALQLGTGYLEQLPSTMNTYWFDVIDDGPVDLWVVCKNSSEFWYTARLLNNEPPDTSGTITKHVGALFVTAYMEDPHAASD